MVIEFWPYGMQRANSYELLKRAMMKYKVFFDLSKQVSEPVRISECAIAPCSVNCCVARCISLGNCAQMDAGWKPRW